MTATAASAATTTTTTGWQGVLLDWAGTTIDFGSRAPAAVFVEIFRQSGVEITVPEARGPMGKAKLDHIAEVAGLPRVAAAWQSRHGRPCTRDDVLAMYERFLPLQRETLARATQVIPGVVEAVRTLRARGLKIGSSTGYTRALMEVVLPLAAQQGNAPDCTLCADDVPAGRPAPDMNLAASRLLHLTDPSRVVAVDDTPVGIEAGRRAGMLTVGITLTGNLVGLGEAELAALSASDRAALHAAAARQFFAAGADHVLESTAHLPDLLDRVSPKPTQ